MFVWQITECKHRVLNAYISLSPFVIVATWLNAKTRNRKYIHKPRNKTAKQKTDLSASNSDIYLVYFWQYFWGDLSFVLAFLTLLIPLSLCSGLMFQHGLFWVLKSIMLGTENQISHTKLFWISPWMLISFNYSWILISEHVFVH